jgi:ATP-binding cassette subfamily F protein uup
MTNRPPGSRKPVTNLVGITAFLIRAQPAARPRRISFNDRRALEMLPARIAELQTQITGLNVVLADPDLYARDPGRFVATSQALAIARDELAAAEEQWLTLEMLREQIDDDERKS